MQRRRLSAGLLLWGLSPVVFAGSYEDFFEAIDRDDVQGLMALLRRGFDPNTLSEKLQHPLHLCVEAGANQALAVLSQAKGIRLNFTNDNDETAMMLAALRDKPTMVKLLIAAGAEVNKPGWTALHYACTAGNPETVAMLLDAHAYIDAESPNGTTPLMMAARYSNERVVNLLLEEGADPTLKNQQDLTALDFALSVDRQDSASLIRAQLAKWGKK